MITANSWNSKRLRRDSKNRVPSHQNRVATNGIESYGAGRFLYSDPPDENGHLILDFNLSYNPPCVFTPFATCPLPAPGNAIDLEITAGEKMFGLTH